MNYRAMRKLIETIKQHSDKINDLLSCENVDNEQIAEEAKAAYYAITDLREMLQPLKGMKLKNNKFEVVHVHNIIALQHRKILSLFDAAVKLNRDAFLRYSFYGIELEYLYHITIGKIKQLSVIHGEQQKSHGKKYG